MKKRSASASSRSFLFRLLLIVFGAILLLILAAAAAAAVRFSQIRRDPPAPEIAAAAHWIDGTDASLGTIRTCRTVVRAPWGSLPGKPSVTPGKGTQLVAMPDFTPEKFSWGFTQWALDLAIQPYRTGETGTGVLNFSFRGSDGNAVLFEQTIPPLSVSEIKDASEGSDLAVAGEIPEREKPSFLMPVLTGIVILSVILAVVLILWRRRRRTGAWVKTIREIAMERISALRKRVVDGMQNPETALSELTDIVRHFLEGQYHLRAERQTTAEFLKDLNHADSPLPDADKRFLHSFLEAADMVKFARLHADPEMFENAALRAEKLVANTAGPVIPEERRKPQ